MTLRRRAACAIALLLGLAAANPATAADLCGALLVPDDYRLTCTPGDVSPDAEEVAVIEPVEGMFRPLSRLTVRRLAEPVGDADAWLRRQVTVDLGGLDDYVAGIVDDVDSPFAGTSFGDALVGLTREFEDLGKLPLKGCERSDPEIGGESVREMRCLYEAGPLRQHLIVRLVDRGGETYALTMRAMNERRLRHLLAIANAFVAS